MYNILSYTYVHFLVLISYLFVQCTFMDCLKLKISLASFLYLTALFINRKNGIKLQNVSVKAIVFMFRMVQTTLV
jgi:hypothetical protein